MLAIARAWGFINWFAKYLFNVAQSDQVILTSVYLFQMYMTYCNVGRFTYNLPTHFIQL